MITPETLEEFYKQKFNRLPKNLGQDVGHFFTEAKHPHHRHFYRTP